MNKLTQYVGLYVHKDSISIAVAFPDVALDRDRNLCDGRSRQQGEQDGKCALDSSVVGQVISSPVRNPAAATGKKPAGIAAGTPNC